MLGLNVYISQGFFFILLQSSPGRSDIPVLQLCHEGNATSDHVYINMDTSLIAGTNELCSCHVAFISVTELELSFQNVTSPKCETKVSLSTAKFQPKCNISYIQSEVQSNSFYNESGFWIHVKSIGSSSHPMSGTIKLRTTHSINFDLRCFQPGIISQPLSTTTQAPPTPQVISNNELPVGAIGTGTLGLVCLVFIAGFAFHRCYRCVRRPSKVPSVPESREHPTYHDLTNRENTVYLSFRPTECAATPASKEHPTATVIWQTEKTQSMNTLTTVDKAICIRTSHLNSD